MPWPQAKEQSEARTLLVVDDREANLVAMEALLGDEDWTVHTVNSGEAALQALLDLDVELVLLDVQMPGMDGFEVARLMRGNPHTRYTPIIFVSAIAHTRESVLRGYATGAVDFVLKPFDPQVLKLKINTLLSHEHNRRNLQLLSQQLDSARAFNASVLNNAAEGILVVGEDGYINFANPAIARMLHTDVEHLQGTALADHLASPQLPDAWRDSDFYKHWRNGETYRLHEAQLNTARGGTLPVALSASPLPRQQRSMVVIALDMSVVRNLHVQLETQAVTDSLTGLLNRRGFHQALDSALARVDRNGKRMAILYIDLDGFKRINDSLGHDAGDEILCRVARLLETCMRPYDIIARMGGDEFTALLDSLDHPEDAARVAEKLIELISVRHTVDGTEVTLGASIGIAHFPDCGQSVEELLRSADMAMYEAKRAGRQQYRFFSKEMNGRAHARLMMEENLRSTIDRNGFDLVYQPQIMLETGELRGFEALLRWDFKGRGEVEPNVFIPLLEETRLIDRVGQWALREGMAQCREWRDSFGKDLVLSFNVSPVQFGRAGLLDDLRRLLDEFQLDPHQLELEVTEGALMQDLQQSCDQLRRLRELGVRVAVDDFGTGYSSLAYLRHFELDTLKIDRLFIANMLDSPRDAAVVSTIIDLGRNLELEVIAEGVETVAQRDWLVAHGCQVMQGFLVAPGLTLEETQNFPSQVDWLQLDEVGSS
ncbi:MULTISPECIES: putative bifunctional diguanylate cyclase/phosphodiesterase [Pseudomonadaceae]|uniref:Response regulator/sensory box/GGDEF domain/EAL domain-containing protein n=1 Tax=Pseudomonas saudiphocaensis TaxID=1499686 RepID=A0A078M224_9PSED|nr:MULTISPECIES: EAL domain-containing protein [Pseudomonadaceae]MBE7928979.1 EAL domain-containing protein [Pseudomonas saudiphocaensis]MCF6782395.1 EAL domain-containing protein [Stutzerimonas stutzeri]MCF6805283.1 EAL domain-containing protein [Stutzerimonas stutzeri]CDZ96136.1 response regulator/sensory box/GGDEF domain/EAL domain-containing protein [Pseudomonas saudiphocaensis]